MSPPTLRSPADAVDNPALRQQAGGMRDSMRLLVVGAGPVADALAPMVAALGWEATSARTMAEVESALREADAVIVTSHDDGVDAPAIGAALAAGISYVGGMGSRKTQARRRDWLVANGVSQTDLPAVRAPIGLDIGADSPGEIAVAILAEIIAVRRGATAVGPISAREGAIHPDQEPGTAYCPEG
ncbi:MAG: XdhC family protein [Nocardioides sp.]